MRRLSGSPRSHSKVARFGSIAFSVAIAFAAGAVVTAVAIDASATVNLPQASPLHVPITSRSFSDPRKVEYTIKNINPGWILSPDSGVLTHFGCTPGAQIISGSAPLEIDGKRKLALATTVPLWRDLRIGDDGSDVKAIQAELSRLGQLVSIDGVFGADTALAYSKLGVSAGLSEASVSHFDRRDIVWLPAPIVTSASCTAQLGTDITAGEKISILDPPAAYVQVDTIPTDLVSGSRVLSVAGTKIAIDASGAGEVAAGVAAQLADPSDDQSSEAKPRNGDLLLAEPTSAFVVPPSAIFGLRGRVGCIQQDDLAIRVRVLGSQLGETFIDVVSDYEVTKVRLAPARALRCE